MRRLGLHIRTGSGLVAAARRAQSLGCTTFQIMSGNPSAWHPGSLDPALALEFAHYTEIHELRPVFLHAGYLINLACRRGRSAPIYAKSILLLQQNLDRAAALGCQAVVVHLGSCLETPRQEAVEAIAHGLGRLKPASVTLLLENSAATGGSMGATFEELAQVLAAARDLARLPLGICLDTAHLWGAGYDLATPDAVARAIDAFDNLVGMRYLGLVHFNDSAVALASRRDRHEHLGCGLIPVEGLEALARDPRLAGVPLVMETPGKTAPSDEQRMDDLRRLAGVQQA